MGSFWDPPACQSLVGAGPLAAGASSQPVPTGCARSHGRAGAPVVPLPASPALAGGACQYRRHGFNPWIRKVLWRRKW